MTKNLIWLSFLCFSTFWLCCNPTTNKKDVIETDIVAEVHGKQLFSSDLPDLAAKGTSPADSATTINLFIESWVKKQLMLTKAEKEIKFDEAEIEKKLLDYRCALMLYAFEKKYVQEKLDTLVTDQEIENYYKDNLANFELKQNIVQGSFIKFPLHTPNLDKIKKLFHSADKQNVQELKSYCFKFAHTYTFADSSWTDFDDLTGNSPFREIPNKVQFLKQNKFTETTDDNFIYLLSIKDYKLSSQTSPMAFVRGQIRDIILNNRKVTLVKTLEKEIYERAVEDKKIKIYSN